MRHARSTGTLSTSEGRGALDINAMILITRMPKRPPNLENRTFPSYFCIYSCWEAASSDDH